MLTEIIAKTAVTTAMVMIRDAILNRLCARFASSLSAQRRYRSCVLTFRANPDVCNVCDALYSANQNTCIESVKSASPIC